MTLFFSSDHHFGHENIIKHCRRPFSSVEEMDQTMIDRWNEVIGPDDDVFHLGDFAHRKSDPKRVKEICWKLNGNIHLICGNHDTDHRPMIAEDNWERVCKRLAWVPDRFDLLSSGYHEVFLDGKLVVLSHYAFETWHDMSKKSWHLHGHSHGKLTKKTRRLDVGVDTHDFRPWSWEEIKVELGGGKKKATKPAKVKGVTKSGAAQIIIKDIF